MTENTEREFEIKSGVWYYIKRYDKYIKGWGEQIIFESGSLIYYLEDDKTDTIYSLAITVSDIQELSKEEYPEYYI